MLSYFAYGSNMLTARLQARVRSARPVGYGRLSGYELRFHKRGTDGSAKCSVLAGPGGLVHGVLFEMAAAEKHVLDRVEGLGFGYDEVKVAIEIGQGSATRVVESFLYVADERYIDDSLRPFDWYRDFVVHGAREHGLPPSYIAGIEAVEVHRDHDRERAQKNGLILAGAAVS